MGSRVAGWRGIGKTGDRRQEAGDRGQETGDREEEDSQGVDRAVSDLVHPRRKVAGVRGGSRGSEKTAVAGFKKTLAEWEGIA
jgi:hypothetical protein